MDLFTFRCLAVRERIHNVVALWEAFRKDLDELTGEYAASNTLVIRNTSFYVYHKVDKLLAGVPLMCSPNRQSPLILCGLSEYSATKSKKSFASSLQLKMRSKLAICRLLISSETVKL